MIKQNHALCFCEMATNIINLHKRLAVVAKVAPRRYTYSRDPEMNFTQRMVFSLPQQRMITKLGNVTG
jgi:hypothetical protein